MTAFSLGPAELEHRRTEFMPAWLASLISEVDSGIEDANAPNFVERLAGSARHNSQPSSRGAEGAAAIQKQHQRLIPWIASLRSQ